MGRILDMRPIAKGNFRQSCNCYSKVMPKNLKLVIDEENNIVFCEHCGNMLSPMSALLLFCAAWENIQYLEEQARERTKHHYQIMRKYKPWKKAMRHIEQNIGRSGERVPVCPHCDMPFKLEDVSKFVDKQYAETDKKNWFKIVKRRSTINAPLPPLTF